jgi:nucleotide-binding universal stress UspA family protein
MFNRILAAVDGSPSSLHALTEILRVGKVGSRDVKVISVVPPYDGELRLVGVRNIAAAMREPYEKALAESEQIAGIEGVSISAVMEQGEPHERVVDLAEAEHRDLIVVGVKGRTACNTTEQLLLGSMTARIIGYSQTDILVIPDDASLDFWSAMVAVDGSTFSAKALKLAFGLQKEFGTKLNVMAVADVPSHLYGVDASAAAAFIARARSNLEEVQKLADAESVKIETMLREGDPASHITEAAGKLESNLIILGSHGRTGLRRLLMGSVAERVICYAPCSVLISRNS